MPNKTGKNKKLVKNSLTMRLLLFTIAFVLVFEAFIFVPAIVQFRTSFLEQRLASGTTAALSLEEIPGNQISPTLKEELLTSAQIQAIIITREDSRMLALRSDMPFTLVGRFDLRESSFISDIKDTFAVFTRGGEGVIQVAGASMTPRFKLVEIVVWEKHLYEAMVAYSFNILGTSLLVSSLTAGFVFVFLQFFVVKPITHMTKSITGFRANPEDARQTLKASSRSDEIGMIERELCRMQEELRQALNQKSKLAELGLAVSKINHDLRNILATAQLSSERLREIKDPTVITLTSRLISSVDRAIDLCESTLKHGRADEAAPNQANVKLHSLLADVGSALGFDDKNKQGWQIEIDETHEVFADADHMFRVFLNLGQNAKQAMGEGGRIVISTEKGGEKGSENADNIYVEDTGYGIPEAIQNDLFTPFINSNKAKGTGLGLVVARELLRAHGGELALLKSGKQGTVFHIRLPVKSKGTK